MLTLEFTENCEHGH